MLVSEIADIDGLGARKGFKFPGRRGGGRKARRGPPPAPARPAYGPWATLPLIHSYAEPAPVAIPEIAIPPGCRTIGRKPPIGAPAHGRRYTMAIMTSLYKNKGWSINEDPSGWVWACPPADAPAASPASETIEPKASAEGFYGFGQTGIQYMTEAERQGVIDQIKAARVKMHEIIVYTSKITTMDWFGKEGTKEYDKALDEISDDVSDTIRNIATRLKDPKGPWPRLSPDEKGALAVWVPGIDKLHGIYLKYRTTPAAALLPILVVGGAAVLLYFAFK